VISPSRHAHKSRPRTLRFAPLTGVSVTVHSNTSRIPATQGYPPRGEKSGIPPMRDASRLRTSDLPECLVPKCSGPLGITKRASSVNDGMV
jgi:hypothetical protein